MGHATLGCDVSDDLPRRNGDWCTVRTGDASNGQTVDRGMKAVKTVTTFRYSRLSSHSSVPDDEMACGTILAAVQMITTGNQNSASDTWNYTQMANKSTELLEVKL